MNRIFLLFMGVFLSACLSVNAQSGFPIYSDTDFHYVATHKMIINSDGTIVVLGNQGETSIGNTLQGGGYIISKYTASGIKLWAKRFDRDVAGDNSMYATDMIKSADSGYIVVGDSSYTTGMVTVPNYLFADKIDEHGNMVWHKAWQGIDANAFGFNVKIRQATLSNRYYVSTYNRLYKLNYAGDSVNAYTASGLINNFEITANGGTVSCDGAMSPHLIISDSNLSVTTSTALTYNTRNYDVYLTHDSCWLVAGKFPVTNAHYQLYLSKFNYSGGLIWGKNLGYNDLVEGMSVTEHNSSYYITANNKTCLNADTPTHCFGVNSVLIVRTDTAGAETGHFTINGNSNSTDSVRSYFGFASLFVGDTLFTVGTTQSLYETGFYGEDVRSSRCMVWKNDVNNFHDLMVANTTPLADLNIYPNPVTNNISLELTPASKTPTSISIRNIMGQEVYHTDLPNLAKWNYAVPGNLADGIYIIQVSGNGISTRKKVLLSRN